MVEILEQCLDKVEIHSTSEVQYTLDNLDPDNWDFH